MPPLREEEVGLLGSPEENDWRTEYSLYETWKTHSHWLNLTVVHIDQVKGRGDKSSRFSRRSCFQEEHQTEDLPRKCGQSEA